MPFDAPKEDAAFWPRLAAREEFSCRSARLFVDDSLRGARNAPASTALRTCARCAARTAERRRKPPADFAAIDGVAELL